MSKKVKNPEEPKDF